MIHALVVVEKSIKTAAENKKCETLFIMNMEEIPWGISMIKKMSCIKILF